MPNRSDASPITGGCQCGAVRYAVHATQLERTHYCHCRMCQRALGNLFAALAGTRKTQFEWTGAQTPRVYASSSVATRGFCPQCGTPLSFAYAESEWIYVTVGSLDTPANAVPERHFGIESQLPWLHLDDALPKEATGDTDLLRTMKVYQHPQVPNGLAATQK
ncbi:GFA family protein [Solimonas marina]|uniref:GFA family protein n=1 Tax=Solimonas marina TaxID=2714601 RepID=A0A969W5S0_9GAMM|nr:GFA family protein [Solimonas marina]NKF21092.1 GFA family protein [Solimonas marina]